MIEWKQLDKPFDNYELSNTGVVRFIEGGKVVPVHLNKPANKIVVGLRRSDNGSPTTKIVARLVADTYLAADKEIKSRVIHLDGDPFNCSVGNLLCTTNISYKSDTSELSLRMLASLLKDSDDKDLLLNKLGLNKQRLENKLERIGWNCSLDDLPAYVEQLDKELNPEDFTWIEVGGFLPVVRISKEGYILQEGKVLTPSGDGRVIISHLGLSKAICAISLLAENTLVNPMKYHYIDRRNYNKPMLPSNIQWSSRVGYGIKYKSNILNQESLLASIAHYGVDNLFKDYEEGGQLGEFLSFYKMPEGKTELKKVVSGLSKGFKGRHIYSNPDDLIQGEVWEPVDKSGGFLLVSNKGRVGTKNIRGMLGASIKVLSLTKEKTGHNPPVLYSKLLTYTGSQRVATAVADKFLGPIPPNSFGVGFKDGDRTNLDISNLMWVL